MRVVDLVKIKDTPVCFFRNCPDTMFIISLGDGRFVVKRENYGYSVPPADSEVPDPHCALMEAIFKYRGTNGRVIACCRCCEEFSVEPFGKERLG